MKGISEKQFWIYMRNFSVMGAIVMLTFALVVAQTDLTELPIGGDTSDEPQVGAIWACATPQGGKGADVDGPWLDTINGTFLVLTDSVVLVEKRR